MTVKQDTAKVVTAKVVTANRLSDGLVVYLDAAGSWSDSIEQARVARDEAAGAALLAEAGRPEQATRVVAPYLIEVVEDGGRLRPGSYREVIRARGPSVRPDVGKQAARP